MSCLVRKRASAASLRTGRHGGPAERARVRAAAGARGGRLSTSCLSCSIAKAVGRPGGAARGLATRPTIRPNLRSSRYGTLHARRLRKGELQTGALRCSRGEALIRAASRHRRRQRAPRPARSCRLRQSIPRPARSRCRQILPRAEQDLSGRLAFEAARCLPVQSLRLAASRPPAPTARFRPPRAAPRSPMPTAPAAATSRPPRALDHPRASVRLPSMRARRASVRLSSTRARRERLRSTRLEVHERVTASGTSRSAGMPTR